MKIDVLQTKHYFAVCVFFQSIFVSKQYLITQSKQFQQKPYKLQIQFTL